MSDYNIFAAINGEYEFPPEVVEALRQSLNIRNVGAPMTTAQRNDIPTADLESGYYIFNTQTQTFQVWRSDFEEWHDGLESPGTQKWWGGNVIPSGWMKQDARSLSRAEYFALYSAIGTTYGGSDTPLHFKIPGAAGRVAVDATSTYYLGRTGGAATVVLSPGQMPKHHHGGQSLSSSTSHGHGGTTSTDGSHTHSYWLITDGFVSVTNDGGNAVYRASRGAAQVDYQGDHAHVLNIEEVNQSHKHGIVTDERGNNEAHENMQPYLASNFIIKY